MPAGPARARATLHFGHAQRAVTECYHSANVQPVVLATPPAVRLDRPVRGSDLHLPLAYIDAGSGSLIIQAVIATAIAVPIILRNQLRRAANALRRVVGVRSERTEE